MKVNTNKPLRVVVEIPKSVARNEKEAVIWLRQMLSAHTAGVEEGGFNWLSRCKSYGRVSAKEEISNSELVDKLTGILKSVCSLRDQIKRGDIK